MELIVEAKNLTKYFGKVRAVNNLSLAIFRGETLGLVGESGCGKTTLARLLLNLISPTSGSVFYYGIENIRRQCQIVFQDPQTSLNPRMLVGEALAEPISIHRLLPKEKIRGRVQELLEMVRLPVSYQRRWPHELSGGERQRVAIARALALSPKFLVLDEPVSSLDVLVQLEILKLLRELKEKLNLTYLFIAHDLMVINYICDRVAVMKDGEILEIGEKNEILSAPKTSYSRILLEASFL